MRREDRSFLLGEDLLIIPRWGNQKIVPHGIWRTVSLLENHQENDGYQPIIKIRGGAIVPLGRIIQNTTENSLEPLTLLLCLNEKGEADGDLYEDEGNGFDYQQGDYALTHYHASLKGKILRVTIKSRQGDRPIPPRRIHLQVILNDRVIEKEGIDSQGVEFNLEQDTSPKTS